MSDEATDWAWQQRTGNATEKAVLLYLARKADPEGHCKPTTREIAEAVRCEQKTARNALDRLAIQGFIGITKGAGQAANAYRLTLPSEVITTARAAS